MTFLDDLIPVGFGVVAGSILTAGVFFFRRDTAAEQSVDRVHAAVVDKLLGPAPEAVRRDVEAALSAVREAPGRVGVVQDFDLVPGRYLRAADERPWRGDRADVTLVLPAVERRQVVGRHSVERAVRS